MSEANNSSWPFSELPDAEGLDFDKIFNQSGGTTTGDTDPFDANPFDEPAAEPDTPTEPVPETARETEPAPAPKAEPEAETPPARTERNENAKKEDSPQPAAPESAESPLEAAFAQKTVENAQKGLFEKPPVFCHKSAKEPIEEPSMTMKESIERSREFLDALKKAKDKNPDCLVKPKVTMQKIKKDALRRLSRKEKKENMHSSLACITVAGSC